MAVAAHPGQRAQLLTPREWPLLEALFREVFGHVLDRNLTRWKYGDRRGISVALIEDDPQGSARAVAHCGVMFRSILAHGRPVRAGQLADLMVAPGDRGRGARLTSPYAQVMALALEQLESPGDRQRSEPIVFGFPSERAMRLSERLGFYGEVDRIHELRWSARPGPPAARVEVATPAALAAVDVLWHAMRADLADALVGVRDGAYFMRRYLEHPTQRYQVYLARSRWWGRPLAAFALRHIEGRLELSDWVAPLSATAQVIDAARAVAAAHPGRPEVSTWSTNRHRAMLAATAQRVEPLPIRIPGCVDAAMKTFESHRDRWWLTPGDTDYR